MAEGGENIYALVTGANTGCGFGIAHRLVYDFLKRPASTSSHITIILAVRSAAKATDTTKRLHKLLEIVSPQERERYTLATVIVDLADLRSVNRLAEQLYATYPYLNVLVCNAGMGVFTGIDYVAAFKAMLIDFIGAFTYPQYKTQAQGQKTLDGLGMCFASNIFGHYYLAHELKTLMGKCSGRVIWQSSLEAYEWSYDVDDLQCIHGTHPYEQTKRLMDILSLTATRPYAAPWLVDSKSGQHKNVRSYLAHPGIVATRIYRDISWWQAASQRMNYVLVRWLGSPWQVTDCYSAALPVSWLALSDEQELEKKEAECKKWGAACDRLGREYLKETPVNGEGDENWDSMARDTWQNMEALREEWWQRLNKRTDQR